MGMNMNFIDNWIYQLDDVLAVDGDALPVPGDAIARLGLADGVAYTVVFSAALAQAGGGVFEIAHVIGGAGGGYTLLRGREGTDAALWPAGTLVMATVTAAQLAGFGGGVDDSGWVTLEPIGSFLYPPDARKIGGVVHLRGFKWIELALLGEPLAQLPVGWRPAQQFYATKPIGDRIRRMSITEDGIEGAGMIFVDHVNGPTASDYFEFDGISFPVG